MASTFTGDSGDDNFSKASALTTSQKHIRDQLDNFLNGFGSAKHVGGGLATGASHYNGNIVPDLVGGWGNIHNFVSNYDNRAGNATANSALSNALSGKQSLQFTNLQAQQMGTKELPSYQSGFNFQPTKVNTYLNGQYTQDYFKKGVVAPMMQNFNDNINPALNASFNAAGAGFSSRRDYARQKALSSMNTDMGAQLATAVRGDEQMRATMDQQNQMFNNQIGLSTATTAEQDRYNAANLNSQNSLNRFNLNSQNQRAYDALNTQTRVGLAESAANRQLQGESQQQQLMNDNVNRMTAVGNMLIPMQNQRNMQGAANYQDFLRTARENNPYFAPMMSMMQSTQQLASTSQGNPVGGGLGGAALGLGLGGLLGGGMAGGMGAGAGGAMAGGIGGMLGPMFGMSGMGGAAAGAGAAGAGGLLGGLGGMLGGIGSGIGAIGSGIGGGLAAGGGALLGLLGMI